MTRGEKAEARWLGCTDPRAVVRDAMTGYRAASPAWPAARVRRLACCALVRVRLEADASRGPTRLRGSAEARSAAEWGEEYSFGPVGARGPVMRLLDDALGAMIADMHGTHGVGSRATPAFWEALSLMLAAAGAVERSPRLLDCLDGWRARPGHTEREAAALRHVLGSPWRKAWVPPPPGDLARTADGMAQDILARRRHGLLDGARLGVLADCLEEAGCADSLRLAALRSPGPHYAGFWALRDIARPAGPADFWTRGIATAAGRTA